MYYVPTATTYNPWNRAMCPTPPNLYHVHSAMGESPPYCGIITSHYLSCAMCLLPQGHRSSSCGRRQSATHCLCCAMCSYHRGITVSFMASSHVPCFACIAPGAYYQEVEFLLCPIQHCNRTALTAPCAYCYGAICLMWNLTMYPTPPLFHNAYFCFHPLHKSHSVPGRIPMLRHTYFRPVNKCE